MKIITGNKNKQNEIKEVIKDVKLPQETIEFVEKDLKEVKGDNVQIILQKVKEANKVVKDDNFIVEDITMFVDNTFVPDIKWKQEKLSEGDRVQVILTVAKKEGEYVKVYERRVNGIVHLNKCDKYDFGFDNVVFVNNEVPLGEYKENNPLRSIYREILRNDIQPDYVFKLFEIPEWKGEYQN